jgi:hypothetical protein
MRPDLRDRFGYDVVEVPPPTRDEVLCAIERWIDAYNVGRVHRLRVRRAVGERLVADGVRGLRYARKRLEYACTTAELCGSRCVELEHLPVGGPPAPIHPGEAALRRVFEETNGSVPAVQARFQVSRSTVYRWRKALGIGGSRG